jgi:hypothetical protein
MNPTQRGFSPQNIWNMRKLYRTYKDDLKLQMLSGEIGWSLNILIIEKCKTQEERSFYLNLVINTDCTHRQLSKLIDNDLITNVQIHGHTFIDNALSDLRDNSKNQQTQSLSLEHEVDNSVIYIGTNLENTKNYSHILQNLENTLSKLNAGFLNEDITNLKLCLDHSKADSKRVRLKLDAITQDNVVQDEITISVYHLSQEFIDICEMLMHYLLFYHCRKRKISISNRKKKYKAIFKEFAEKHGMVCEQINSYNTDNPTENSDLIEYSAPILTEESRNWIIQNIKPFSFNLQSTIKDQKISYKKKSYKYQCPQCEEQITIHIENLEINCPDCKVLWIIID